MDLAFKSPGTTSQAKHHTAVGPARTPIATDLLTQRCPHRGAHTDVTTLSVQSLDQFHYTDPHYFREINLRACCNPVVKTLRLYTTARTHNYSLWYAYIIRCVLCLEHVPVVDSHGTGVRVWISFLLLGLEACLLLRFRYSYLHYCACVTTHKLMYGACAVPVPHLLLYSNNFVVLRCYLIMLVSYNTSTPPPMHFSTTQVIWSIQLKT